MKRISPGTVTVIVLAIVCGLVAAYVVRLSLTSEPEVVKEEPPEPKYSFVIARNNIPMHRVVQEEDVQVISVPLSKKPAEDAEPVLRKELVIGRVARETIKAGWMMKEKYLLEIGERLPSVAERLPAGHRALAIEVEHPAGPENIEPGSYVDIAMSVEGDHPDLGELSTRTLVRSIKVMDIASSDPRRRSTSDRLAMTVAVTPRDANKLITAEQTGALTVTLCSVQDGEQPVVEGDADSITRKELLGLRDLPTPAPLPAPPAPYQVEQWRGARRDVLELAPEDQDEEPSRSVTSSQPRQPSEDRSASIVRPRVIEAPSLTGVN